MIGAGTFLQQRYRIDKQIGQGGMGAVYVATDERFGSTVAIKETLCNDDHYRKAIEREARLLNSLKHVALPRVTDHFEEDNGLFLVMEYIPGEDFGHVLDEKAAPFEVEQVLTWADQLLDALDFLHTQEMPVVHRDIKPQNLKLTSRGQIILLDFGLAKGNPTDASHKTAAKSIFGYSRNYASLEQIQGTGTDPRSDLYSLAATLYHLLTGVAPEDALTRAMAVLSQKSDPLVPANSLRPEVPRGVAGVLIKAMDLNASERPASAAEMRQMLRESENYAYLADPVTVINPPLDPRVFAQQTKIMPEGTQAEPIRQTDMKTEVLPGFMSEVTSVRNVTTEPEQARSLAAALPPRPKSRAAAASAIGLLLVGGLAAAGLYVTKPEIFGTAPAANTAQFASPASDTSSGDLTNANSASVFVNSNTGASNSAAAAEPITEAPAVAEKPKAIDPAEKPADPSKAGKATPKTPAGGDEFVFTSPDADGQGPVTMRKSADGTTTIITKDGTLVSRPDPPQPGMRKLPPGFDPNNMTPEQMRKLRTILRNQQKRPEMMPIPPDKKPQ
ncbi:MAG: protein kinase [Pyrinomonadaceae bacterium]|nr:protein kinase [Acidobacteriota bacterium]MBK7933917.1 protein kinase [Acidobacteriota bacterium]MBP7416091.1 protein kinase [Pyrinomonadaceae bacterium]